MVQLNLRAIHIVIYHTCLACVLKAVASNSLIHIDVLNDKQCSADTRRANNCPIAAECVMSIHLLYTHDRGKSFRICNKRDLT